MAKKVSYIPTLQEFMKKRKKHQLSNTDFKSCMECNYFKKDQDVCVWGGTVKIIPIMKVCPITHKELV